MNTVSIQFFGLLAEITGKQNLVLENVSDTDNMNATIQSLFPKLQKQNYMVAVNNTMINSNTALSNNCKVACMPPFAGG